eukprot:3295325-Pleurochrysis_carterae.AAC.11
MSDDARAKRRKGHRCLRAMAAVALHALLQMLLLATGQASDEWLYAEPGETIANSEVQARWGEVSPTCSYGSEQAGMAIANTGSILALLMSETTL